jgi:hypothetical protein
VYSCEVSFIFTPNIIIKLAKYNMALKFRSHPIHSDFTSYASI